jgi:hypothetical protein
MAKKQSNADSACSFMRILTLVRRPAIGPARPIGLFGSGHSAVGAEVCRHHSVAPALGVSANS